MTTGKKSTSVRGRQRDRRAKLKPQDWTLGLEVVHPKAAGIDVGNSEHYVAIPPSLDAEPVRRFGCFTAELVALAEWLQERGIETVAMQSTGVYWIPLYEILSAHGLRVLLVNARDTRNMPGHKTDVQECQWLLKLHVYGLLKNSFRPEEEIAVMRTLWRQRQQHTADASRCIQRMHKALTQMNLQLANVISDISGWTGQAIIRAILAGERNPRELAKLRDPRVRATPEVIAKSLEGHWRPELLFVLEQEWDSYHSFQRKIQECDQELHRHLQTMPAKADPEALPECPRGKRPRGNVPEQFDLREQLYRIVGVDLTGVDGINVLTAQTIIAEVGYDMGPWETEAQFVSWLNLAPRNRISGGKVIGRDRRKVVNRAGQALRTAATALLHSRTYLGAQFRRFRTKLGAPKAVKAMAGKLARIIYRLLKYGQQYVDKGAEFYEQKYRQQQIKMITKKATELGFQLVQPA
ncbi:MAG: IS110 family transposase [Terriglobales bacterium]